MNTDTNTDTNTDKNTDMNTVKIIKVCVSSLSDIKLNAVRNIFKSMFGSEVIVIPLPTGHNNHPVQPVNTGRKCVINRNDAMKEMLSHSNREYKYDYLVSIENEIVFNKNNNNGYVVDLCHVLVEDKNGNVYINSDIWNIKERTASYIDLNYYVTAVLNTPGDYSQGDDGLAVTLGSILSNDYPEIPHNNWMKYYDSSNLTKENKNKDRYLTIKNELEHIITYANNQNTEQDIDILRKAIIKEADFPVPGVMFKDLSDILVDGNLLNKLSNQLYRLVQNNLYKYDLSKVKIMGLDARGFIYGSLLASKLNCGFIMVRKASNKKVPGKTLKQEYGTEYSKSCIEIMPHLINEGDLIIVADDLVATGGSLKAAIDLAQRRKATVIGCVTVLQVEELIDQANEKIKDIPLLVLIK